MSDFINSLGLAPIQWGLVVFAAALIGANKTGLVNISLIAISIFAAVFGGKVSTGIMLPILLTADFFAVASYRKFVQWKVFIGIFPWAFLGVFLAVFVGNNLSDKVFKLFIAGAILSVSVFLIYKEISGNKSNLKSNWYTNAAIGIFGGFASMMGNASGPIMSVYFLSIGMEKNSFVATRAWFFWLMNLIKLPLQIFVWKTVTLQSFCFNLLMLPAIAIGAVGGLLLVKRIPERPYRIFVIIATLVSSVFLII